MYQYFTSNLKRFKYLVFLIFILFLWEHDGVIGRSWGIGDPKSESTQVGYIHFRVYSLGNGINPSLLLPAMDK